MGLAGLWSLEFRIDSVRSGGVGGVLRTSEYSTTSSLGGSTTLTGLAGVTFTAPPGDWKIYIKLDNEYFIIFSFLFGFDKNMIIFTN